MENLDVLLLSVLVLYLLGLPIRRERIFALFHFLPLVSLVLSASQIIFDGFRWQMSGAYFLSLILFISTSSNLFSLLKGKKAETRTKTWIRITGLTAGMMICLISFLATWNFPKFKFPEPTGDYAVGTDYLSFSDSSRTDLPLNSTADSRTISVRLWFPAQINTAKKPSFYQNKVSAGSIAELFRLPHFSLDYLSQINSHAYENVKLLEKETMYPVIIFSPSAWINHTTALNEELASHGFVVLAVGHTSTEPFIYDSEGNILPMDPRNPYHFKIRQELYSQKVESIKDQILRSADMHTKRRLHRELNQYQPLNVKDVQMRAGDISYVIDELPCLNKDIFSARLDLDKIGVMGFSKGGATTGEVCINDERVTAGLNMDGFMYGNIVNTGLKIPFMFMHSESAVRDAFINDLFYQEAESPAYMLKIKGTTHANFGDLSLFNGIFKNRGILGKIEGRRCIEIQRAYVLAFFNTYLKGKRSPLLEMRSSKYPEVELYTKIDKVKNF